MKKLVVILVVTITFFVFLSTPAVLKAASCDESGENNVPGSAYKIGFKNGLVPCGKELINLYLCKYPKEKTYLLSSIVKPFVFVASDANDCTNQCKNSTPPELQLKTAIFHEPSRHGYTCDCVYAKPEYTYANEYISAPSRDKAQDICNAKGIQEGGPVWTVRDLGKTPFCKCQLYHIFVLILNIYNFIALYLALPLAGLLIVIGGLLILLQGINSKFYDIGKMMLKGAGWGLLLIFGAWLIIDILFKALGINIPWDVFPIL